VLTFATAGDLSVTYSAQAGVYVKLGRLVLVIFDISTSAFTHTTAAENLQITGNTFANGAGVQLAGAMTWQGITKAGYSQVSPIVESTSSTILAIASGSGVAGSNVVAADMPTGGTPALRGFVLCVTA
jgi:hypothetical protein